MDIKIGMTVWLKSGGPSMTVQGIARQDVWACSWFVGTKLNHGSFNSESLTDIDPALKSDGFRGGSKPKNDNSY